MHLPISSAFAPNIIKSESLKIASKWSVKKKK